MRSESFVNIGCNTVFIGIERNTSAKLKNKSEWLIDKKIYSGILYTRSWHFIEKVVFIIK